MINKYLNYCGLKRPYKFDVAIPFLISIIFLAFIILVGGIYSSLGYLHIGTPRFKFFIFIGLMFSFSAIFCRYKFSYAILLVSILEISLALITSIGKIGGLMNNQLMPDDSLRHSYQDRFVYHPTLQGVPRLNYQSKNGVDVTHNSLGIRGKEIGNIENSKLIFVYGGSTTYDIGVDQGKTWVENLERDLAPPYKLLNFGVPGFTTVENLIQTLFYQKVDGRYPICAIYYEGWNDLRNAYSKNLDSGYADWHLSSQITNLSIKEYKDYTSILATIIINYIRNYFNNFYNTPIIMPVQYSNNLEKLKEIYNQNIKSIIALNNSRGVKTVFIGQILNAEILVKNTPYGWLPFVNDSELMGLIRLFNAILKESALQGGATYIEVDQNQFIRSDFIDQGHFSEAGSLKFAKLVETDVLQICR